MGRGWTTKKAQVTTKRYFLRRKDTQGSKMHVTQIAFAASMVLLLFVYNSECGGCRKAARGQNCKADSDCCSDRCRGGTCYDKASMTNGAVRWTGQRSDFVEIIENIRDEIEGTAW